MKFKSLMLMIFLAAIQVGAECEPTPTPTPTPSASPSPSPSASPSPQPIALEYKASQSGTGSDSVAGISKDSSGNVVAAGTFYNTLAVTNQSITSKGQSDMFVVKYSPSGSVVWAKGFGGTNYDSARSVVVDKVGNVYASMLFSGTLQIGDTTYTAGGSSDILLLKLSASDGSTIFVRQLGGKDTESMNAMAVDSQNNLLMTGFFRGEMSFGGAVLKVPFTTDLDVFLVKYTPAGQHVWSKNFKNDGNDQGKGIAVDASDNIALTGTFSNTINFGGSDLTSQNAMTNAFVARFTKDGVHTWSRFIGNQSANEDARGIAFDGSNNMVVTGTFMQPVDFGGGSLSTAGSVDGFLAVYGPDGSFKWVQALGGTNSDYTNAVTTTPNAIYVVGYFTGTAQFGGISATAVGTNDAFLVKYSNSGVPQWVKSYGGRVGTTGYQTVAQSVAFTSMPVFGGYFYGTMSGMTAAGAADGFVMQVKE
jgi:hypothetical protein